MQVQIFEGHREKVQKPLNGWLEQFKPQVSFVLQSSTVGIASKPIIVISVFYE